MAFALLIIGAVLLISAVKNTSDGLFTLVRGDFTGPQNFVYWMVSILIIGALGYIPKLKPLSIALLGLVVIVLFLTRGDPSKAGGGFFEKFTAGLGSTVTPPKTATAASPVPGGFNQPGSVINQPTQPLSFPFLPPITPMVQ